MAPANKKDTRQNNFLVQGSILAVAGILVRIIGLIYRIPFVRIVGDEGNGYYSVAFEIYNIVLILSSYAFPTAISKLISGRIAEEDYKNADRIFRTSLVYATIIGALGCLFMALTAGWFADVFYMLPGCRYALLALAPTIWIMSYLGVLRGYFQGQKTMVPTAISQILEQIVNAAVSVGAAWFFYNAALEAAGGDTMAAARGAMGGTIGTGAGALTALIMILIVYLSRRSAWKARIAGVDISGVAAYTSGETARLILLTILPIVLSQIVYNINTILDSKFFSEAMISSYGYKASEVAAEYGAFTGRFKILINVPIAISNAIALSLVPTLAEAYTKKDHEAMNSGIGRAQQYISLIAMPAAVGLTVLGGPIISLLLGPSEIASNMTIIGSFAILFTSVSTITNAVLHGTNHMNKPVVHSVISLAVHLVSLFVMLYVFRLGVYSLVIANLIFAVCMCILNAYSMRRELGFRQEYRQTFLLPLVSALVMGAVTLAVRFLIRRFITGSNLVIVIACLAVAIAVYVIMIFITGCITKKDLKHFPVIGKYIR